MLRRPRESCESPALGCVPRWYKDKDKGATRDDPGWPRLSGIAWVRVGVGGSAPLERSVTRVGFSKLRYKTSESN